MFNNIIPIKGIAKAAVSVNVVQTRFVSLPTMLRNKQSMQPADICFCYSSSYLLIYSFTFFGFFFSEGCVDEISPFKCVLFRKFGLCSSELHQQKMIEKCPKSCDFCGKRLLIFKKPKNRTRLKNQ